MLVNISCNINTHMKLISKLSFAVLTRYILRVLNQKITQKSLEANN